MQTVSYPTLSNMHSAGRLITASVSVIAGIILQTQQSTLNTLHLYQLATYSGGVILLYLCRPARLKRYTVHNERSLTNLTAALCAALCGLALGFGSTGWRATDRLAQTLAAQLEEQDLLIQGQVIGLPTLAEQGSHFLFAVESAQLSNRHVIIPKLILLSWFSQQQGSTRSPRPAVQAGQRWRWVVRLKPPHGLVNPGSFDTELWCFEQGIRAVGHIYDKKLPPQLLATHLGSSLPRWRQSLRERIFEHVSDPHQAGLLSALTLGDQAAIPQEDWDIYRRTGIAHLVSISGSHITMFAWLASALIARFWRLSPYLMLKLATPYAARIGGVLLALAYALFAGWAIPAQRTIFMLATSALLSLIGCTWPWWFILDITAVIVLLWDPWACLQAGFWLSFVAVSLLLLLGQQPLPSTLPSHHSLTPPAASLSTFITKLKNILRPLIEIQVLITLVLSPLTLLFFNQLALAGLVANVIAIPVVSFMLTPLALLGAVWPAAWAAAASVAAWLLALLQHMSTWPWAVIYSPTPPTWFTALLTLSLLLVIGVTMHTQPRLQPKLSSTARQWACSLLAMIAISWLFRWLVVAQQTLKKGEFELIAADIGQGTAVLIRTRQHLLLYDTGPRYGLKGEGGDAGAKVLLPLLRTLGVQKIDTLILSHADTDHIGGAASLLKEIPIRQLSSSLPSQHPLVELATQRGLTSISCQAGQSWHWDEVEFTVLHPETEPAASTPPAVALTKPRKDPTNPHSCVLQIRSHHQSLLLTGDIERKQEKTLVKQWGDRLKSDILVVPHHGSKTSSTEELLLAVQPDIAVIQAGYHNHYKHPHPQVVQRYHAHAIQVVSSPSCGAYIWGPNVASCERKLHPHYWHTPLPPP